MSGGVDSSVAAAVLIERGFDVVGMSMEMSGCSARDRMDAKEVCGRLSIPHFAVDVREDFRREVMAPFVAEYAAGRTPSPCALCNALIKFPALMREADRLGAPLVATGHYARVAERGGRFRLLRARDPKKDQSYFLFRAGQPALSRLLLPLGDMRKDGVRLMARELGFKIAGKRESQEVCFAPDGDYAAFVESWEGAPLAGPGEFVDASGRTLGVHRGIHRYTVGQRRGIGFGGGARRYVTAIDAAANRVVLGPDGALMRREIALSGVTWAAGAPASACTATVKIRSTHRGAAARIEPLPGGDLRVIFESPVRAAAAGQAAVIYDGDEVAGGGWIE